SRCRTLRYAPIGCPTTSGRASSSVRRMFSPPGTSPTPVRPPLSVAINRLRVKNGPCAPLRLSSMLSRPATGITRKAVTMGVSGIASIRGDLAGLDDLLPARELLLLERRELLRRVADDLEAERREALAHRRIVERCDDRGVELSLHVRRKAFGRHDRLPRIDVDPLHPCLRQRRHVRQQRRALVRRDGERAQLARLDVLDYGADVLERTLDPTTEKIRDGRRTTLVGHVDALRTRLLPEELGREMVGGSA